MPKKYQYALMAITCLIVFFIHIGVDEMDTMEAYNYVTAREMAENSQWLVPTMKEDVRLVKPLIPVWITAALYKVAGESSSYAVMRIPGAFMAILLVIATWGFVRSYTRDEETAFITAIILAVNVLVIVTGRRNTWDMYTTAFMMFGIWALFDAWKGSEENRRAFIIAGLLLGATFMSKWMVSFYAMLFPFLVAYIYEFGSGQIRHKKAGLVLCLLAFLLVSLPWPLYILLKFPHLSDLAKDKEIIDLGHEHVRPFYFYLHFPLFSGVWLPFLLSYAIKPYAASRLGNAKRYLFPVIWLAVGLLLLIAIPMKKDRYLLPLSVPMSMMAGYVVKFLVDSFRSNIAGPGDRRLLNIHTVLLIILSAALPVVDLVKGGRNWMSGLFMSELAVVMAFIAAAIYLRVKRSMTGMVVHSTLLVCFFVAVTWPMITRVDHDHPDYQSVDELLKIEEIKGKTLNYIDPIHITVIWDLGEIAKIHKIRKGEQIPLEEMVILFPTEPQLADFEKVHPEFAYRILRELRYSPTNKDRKMLVTLLKPKLE